MRIVELEGEGDVLCVLYEFEKDRWTGLILAAGKTDIEVKDRAPVIE